MYFYLFQAEDGIRDLTVTGVQTCALPISLSWPRVRWLSCAGDREAPTTATERGAWRVCRAAAAAWRSEERRVGKECRFRWSPYHYKKKRRKTMATWVSTHIRYQLRT